MSWALWLAAPLAVTTIAALLSWWRGRPVRTPQPLDAMRAHAAYLDALVTAPRGKARIDATDIVNPGDVSNVNTQGAAAPPAAEDRPSI
jgi:hypothetical protein